jgi:hypothetical protein
MNIPLGRVRHTIYGFQALAQFAALTDAYWHNDLRVDMTSADWFDADMCAPFGAILYRLGRRGNSIELQNIPPRVETILSKNGFLSHYSREAVPDKWGTTISYQRFDVKDDRFFGQYIEKELVRRGEIPHMSAGLLKRFRESIFEIFSNAVIHSRTKLGIYSCGQFFPNKNRLDFSIADLGMGIRHNLKETRGMDLSAHEAIIWAVTGHNTTKNGPVPGGLGLKLLREFITKNRGNIQIVSDRGYWSLNGGTQELPHRFPGTVVNIEINTADTKSYHLLSELRPEDVF